MAFNLLGTIQNAAEQFDPFGQKAALANLQSNQNLAAQQDVARSQTTSPQSIWTSRPAPTIGQTLSSSTTAQPRTNTVSTGEPAPQPTGGTSDGGGYDPAAAAQAELDAALGELNYQKEGLMAQSANLDTQRAGALSTVDTEYGKAQKEKDVAVEEAKSATEAAQSKALSTAQDVTKKNRNVLRALGILSSSAGGEILTKAMTEYGTQSGELQSGLLKRLSAVEDWWTTRQADFAKMKTDIEQQYATLKENISRDLRFNDTQRLSAVKAATAAAQQRIYEVQQQAKAYQDQAQQYSNNLLLQIAQMKMYQNPTADVSAIYNQLLSQAQGVKQPTSPTELSYFQRQQNNGILSG